MQYVASIITLKNSECEQASGEGSHFVLNIEKPVLNEKMIHLENKIDVVKKNLVTCLVTGT